jgi:hydrogenase maturation protease
MTPPRILIACIGNIFLGDDGFGTEVARRLAGRALPPEVTLRDFGISGIDLTYALLDPYDLVILVDACPRGGEPGTLYLIEPKTDDGVTAPFEAHSMNPVNVLRTARSMGGARGRILLVGCEPADLGPEEGKLGLSNPVESAIEEAVGMIDKLVAENLGVSQSH